MRSGAGKLRMATVENVAVGTSLEMPEAMVLGFEEARDGGFTKDAVRRLLEEAGGSDVVVAGPGMASAGTCEALARRIGPIGFLAREIPDEIPGLLPR